MLVAYTETTAVVGLTRGNVDHLLDGHPLILHVLRPVAHVLVVFGETKPDIIAQIEAMGGPRFEAAHRAAAEADPS